MANDADVIIVGAGLAGLVAAIEIADAGRRVIILDQEGEQSLGGQAFWSLGGIFLVDSAEQRRMGIRDSFDLARDDWFATAGFDRDCDHWPRQWAEAYLAFAAGEKRAWLRARGIRFFPVVGWAERGGDTASGRGNSVPRFHVSWGTGPGVVEPFATRVLEAARQGRIELKFRHRVTGLTLRNGAVEGVTGDVLAATAVPRGEKSARDTIGRFELNAPAVLVASGGIGANLDLVRASWPERLGPPPKRMVQGVPDFVDGSMLAITEQAGASLINRDRMWHYTEGVRNWNPIWTNHAIRILPGPSSMWLDATGERLPVPLLPGFDTLGTLKHILATGYDYSWFVLTKRIIAKEFALSGSEQNPDMTSKSWLAVVKRALKGVPAPVQAFMDHGADFVIRDDLESLVEGMNALTGGTPALDARRIREQIEARDRQLDNPFAKDMQVTALRAARAYRGDRLTRVATPHKLLDPDAGPLIAVRLSILTRKFLGGLETNLDGAVLGVDGRAIAGLYAAGEASGFGGGGMHGYAALEGTFLGGCIFSGRTAGRAIAKAVA